VLRSIVKKLLAKRRRFLAKRQLREYSRYQKCYDVDLTFSQAATRFTSRNALHSYMHHYFWQICPTVVREHRHYFSTHGRGFGEDAFHAMWWLLLREFRPVNCLEIGVFRGQVISLWRLIANLLDMPCEVHGISPFAPVGDAVSLYPADLDYLADTKEAFAAFGLRSPTLVRALSTDRSALEHICGRDWDLIYIDGSHDYEVVAADYRHCVGQLRPGGLLVMDDASLGTEFRPPLFSFAGHPGPSRVAAEFAMKELNFLGAVGHNNVFVKPQDSHRKGVD
jgi:methyltransferase family protein